jgi:hypothetical protein
MNTSNVSEFILKVAFLPPVHLLQSGEFLRMKARIGQWGFLEGKTKELLPMPNC